MASTTQKPVHKTVQSVDRALKLLETIAAEPQGLVEVSSSVDLPLTTTSRLLATLQQRDAVHRDHDGVYRIGPFVRNLAASDRSTASIEAAAHRHVAALADELGEAACISIPIGAQTLTIMQIDVPKPVQAQDWTGHRWDITAGGSGAVMMATWPVSRVDPLLVPLSRSERDRARSEIQSVGTSGVSWSHGTHVEGLSSIAAAIVDSTGRAVAAVLGYGPSYRFPPTDQVAAIEENVRATALAISNDLES